MLFVSSHTANAISPLAEDQSWVMFLQMRAPTIESGPIKIEGVRGSQIGSRLGEIAAENAYEMFLIGLHPTNEPNELAQLICEQHASAHMHHDWFEPSPELVAFIQHTAQQALADLLEHARSGNVPDGAVDIEEIAALLGLSTKTIRRLVKARQIPFLRTAKALRFVPADVIASLRQLER